MSKAKTLTEIPEEKKYLRTTRNYKHVGGWTTKQKSLTVPNQTMTLREIANRFAAGLTNLDEKIALYDNGQRVIKDFDKLDITVRMELLREAESQIHELRNKRQIQAKKKYEDEFNTHVQKLVDQKLAEQQRETEKTAAMDGKNR